MFGGPSLTLTENLILGFNELQLCVWHSTQSGNVKWKVQFVVAVFQLLLLMFYVDIPSVGEILDRTYCSADSVRRHGISWYSLFCS